MASGDTFGDKNETALFGPRWDFFLLGGGSLLVLPIFYLIGHNSPFFTEQLLGASAALSIFFNFPHFIHSYRLLYRQFPAKIRQKGHPLRWRFLWSGVGVPLLLVLILAWVWQDASLARAGGLVVAMLMLVGWHYVKQGYGILMLLSARKKAFFNPLERRALLWNSYGVWLATVLLTASHAGGRRELFFSIPYVFPAAPFWFAQLAVAIALYGAMLVAYLLWKRHGRAEGTSRNGLVAYLTTLYAWMLLAVFLHPALLLLVPVFHSLQYLTVVQKLSHVELEARMEPTLLGNARERANNNGLLAYLLWAILCGLLLFHLMPLLAAWILPRREGLMQVALTVALVRIAVNYHHYFIDNAIWRRENSDVMQKISSTKTQGIKTLNT